MAFNTMRFIRSRAIRFGHPSGRIGAARLLMFSCASLLAALIAASSTHVLADDDPITSSGDVDGDMMRDDVLADPGDDELDVGQVAIYSGDDGALVVQFGGSQPGDRFGKAVHASSDLNGDGFLDVLIAAPAIGTGRVYLYLGPFDDVIAMELSTADADAAFLCPDPFWASGFGEDVAVVPDMTGDGVPEVRVRAAAPDGPFGTLPVTYLLDGATTYPLYRIDDASPFDPWLELPGDVDRDGDVDQADYDYVATHIGLPGGSFRAGDFDDNGVVDPIDLEVVEQNLGSDLGGQLEEAAWGDECDVVPSGWHCVQGCYGETFLLPEGIWFICIDCPGGGCYVKIAPNLVDEYPLIQPLYSERELHAYTTPLGGAIEWWIIEGVELLELNSDLEGPTIDVKFLHPGPVHLMAVRENCTGCFSDYRFTIGRSEDSDGDGLFDYWEDIYGLSPTHADSDCDGIPDGLEDEDGDGLINLWEFWLGLHPFHDDAAGADPDGDGIPSLCEGLLGSDPDNAGSPSDPNADSDNDGLRDADEVCIFETDPDYYDTDSDGLPDGWEVENSLNPLLADSDGDRTPDWEEDRDYDGMTELDEWLYGTDPQDLDTDDDGTTDGVEAEQGSDPLDSSDEGQAPAHAAHIRIIVGDPSESESERWMLRVGPTGAAAPGYGTVIETLRTVPRDQTHAIQLVHLGSTERPPDLDYRAWVEVIDDNVPSAIRDPHALLEPGMRSNASPDSFDDERAYLDLPLNDNDDGGSGGDDNDDDDDDNDDDDDADEPSIDLDIDSDNDNGFGTPDRSDAEDDLEDVADDTGKLLAATTKNVDEDSVPDYADGYNLDCVAGNDDDLLEGRSFPPLLLTIPGLGDDELDLDSVTLTFDYPASDPLDVDINVSQYALPDGAIRLWRRDANSPRSGFAVDHLLEGDFVPSRTVTARELGFEDGDQSIALYVEGIVPTLDQTNHRIQVSLNVDGATVAEDAVRVRPYDLHHLAFDDETGEVYPAPLVTGPSNLTPDLSIHLMDARITEVGAIEVDITGHVKDRLSELADDPTQRLQSIRFYVNGQEHSAIDDLPSMSQGPGIMPWQPHLLEVDFATTLVIDPGLGYARARGYAIDALTSPNAAGRTAKDSIHVAVQWRLIEGLFNAPVAGDTGLTLAFVADLTDADADWGWAYFGDREPLPTDGTISEAADAPASLLFEGTLLLLDHSSEVSTVPCSVQIATQPTCDPDTIDSFDATTTYEFEPGSSYTTESTWLETAPDSLRFVQTTRLAPTSVEVGIGSDCHSYLIPMIVRQEDIDQGPEGPNGWMDRTLLRVVGLGNNVDPPILAGMVNDIETPLEPFTFSPTYYYFVQNDERGRPRIFVVTLEELPEGVDAVIPDNLFITTGGYGLLENALKINGHQDGGYITTTLFDDDFGSADEIGEPPSGPLTLSVVLTYFQLLYGDTGIKLLRMFQDAGGVIELGDVWGDLDVECKAGPVPLTMRIEEDIDAVTAAGYLFTGLEAAFKCIEMRRELDASDHGIQFWYRSVEQQFKAAANLTVSATRFYLSGIAVFNEGFDFVLTVHELTQGNWEAAIGFLPVISSSMTTTGKVVIRGAGGTVLCQFSQPIVRAIAHAKTLPNTITARFPGLKAAGVTPKQMKILVKDGTIPVAKRRGGLREAMEAMGDPPAGIFREAPHAHHELPWGIKIGDRRSRHVFAEYGFDVNDPQFGKWVEPRLHNSWHSMTNGWTEQWKVLLTQLDGGTYTLSEGRQMILDQLSDMRAQYGFYGEANKLFPWYYPSP